MWAGCAGADRGASEGVGDHGIARTRPGSPRRSARREPIWVASRGEFRVGPRRVAVPRKAAAVAGRDAVAARLRDASRRRRRRRRRPGRSGVDPRDAALGDRGEESGTDELHHRPLGAAPRPFGGPSIRRDPLPTSLRPVAASRSGSWREVGRTGGARVCGHPRRRRIGRLARRRGRAAAPHRRGRVARYPAAPRRRGRGCGPTGGRPGGAHDPGRGDGEGSRGGATPAAATTAAPVAAETGRHTHPTSIPAAAWTSDDTAPASPGWPGSKGEAEGPHGVRQGASPGGVGRREKGSHRRDPPPTASPPIRPRRGGDVAKGRCPRLPIRRPRGEVFSAGPPPPMGGNEPDRRGRSRPGCSGGPEKSSLPSGRSRENRSAG